MTDKENKQNKTVENNHKTDDEKLRFITSEEVGKSLKKFLKKYKKALELLKDK